MKKLKRKGKLRARMGWVEKRVARSLKTSFPSFTSPALTQGKSSLRDTGWGLQEKASSH